MKLIQMIKHHEGLRLKPYRCTAGKWTIGYGRNIEDNGISEAEADLMLLSDIKSTVKTLRDNLPFFTGLSPNRQDALTDMCFNLGWTRFSGFKRMLGAIYEEDYARAAGEMLDSKWAKQTGRRALRLADIMKEG